MEAIVFLLLFQVNMISLHYSTEMRFSKLQSTLKDMECIHKGYVMICTKCLTGIEIKFVCSMLLNPYLAQPIIKRKWDGIHM